MCYRAFLILIVIFFLLSRQKKRKKIVKTLREKDRKRVAIFYFSCYY